MDSFFFITSKLISFAFNPLTWIFALLLWTALVKNPKRKKKLLIMTLCIFYFFSNSFIVDEVMRWWEVPAVSLNKNKEPYDYVVVLGGMMSYYDAKTQQIGLNTSVDRLMQGLKLLNKGYAKKMIITGGDGSILKTIGKEAEFLKEYLTDIGIQTENIIFESDSKNTYENAKFTANILQNDTIKKVIIVTSAFHMRRSLACFNKQGIPADYYPAERYAGKRKFQFDHMFLPNIKAIDLWDRLIHEWIGFIAYKLAGYV